MPQTLTGKTAYRHMIGILSTRQMLIIIFLMAQLAGASFSGSVSTVQGQEPVPVSVELEVGFDSKARVGSWTPVDVLLENRGPDFAGEVHVGEWGNNAASARYVADVVLPRGSRKRLTIYAQPNFPRLRVELISEGDVVTKLEPRVNFIDHTDVFVGVVGDGAGAWNLLTTLEIPGEGEVVVVNVVPDTFPQRPEALDALDVIALADVPAQTLSAGALEALEAWVAGGGTLILPGGSNVERNLKGLPGGLMPVVPVGVAKLESALALERLGGEAFPTTYPLTVSVSHALSGRVLAQEGEVPMAVLSRSGQGRVLFLAFDPMAQPLAGWSGMPKLWRELLFQSLPSSVLIPDIGPNQSWARSSGWSSQFYSAVYNLPALEFPSINVLFGLIAGYIVLVGPVNYLALRRLRRTGLMWVTIPVLVLVFSGSIYLLAVDAKGSDIQVSSVSIVQEVPDSDWARVRSIVGVLTPDRADHRVHILGSSLIAPWEGSRPFRSSGDSEVIIRNGRERSELKLVNMRKWTMRGLRIDSVRRVEETLADNLYVEGNHLKGTVSNSSPVPLRQVWLIASGVATDLGGLEPGETATVDWPLMGPAGGQSNLLPLDMLHETIHPSGGRSSETVGAEDRTRQQLQDLIMAASEFLYTDLQRFGANLHIMAWTGETPTGVTVDGEEPVGSSITLVVKPVVPRLQGRFSLPSDLIMGRIVGTEGETENTDPGLIPITDGSVIYQFEVDANVREDLRGATLQLPFLDEPRRADVSALAYHWEDDTWEPLELKKVALPSQVTLLNAQVDRPAFRPVFGHALEVELDSETGLPNYVSSTGLIRVKLNVDSWGIGTPSLAIEGEAQ